jgi:hypothetical protein
VLALRATVTCRCPRARTCERSRTRSARQRRRRRRSASSPDSITCCSTARPARELFVDVGRLEVGIGLEDRDHRARRLKFLVDMPVTPRLASRRDRGARAGLTTLVCTTAGFSGVPDHFVRFSQPDSATATVSSWRERGGASSSGSPIRIRRPRSPSAPRRPRPATRRRPATPRRRRTGHGARHPCWDVTGRRARDPARHGARGRRRRAAARGPGVPERRRSRDGVPAESVMADSRGSTGCARGPAVR